MSQNAVLYHAGCYDGFGAAWAAWTKYGDSARYLPVKYGDPLPAVEDASAVYVLDFSYPRAVLEELHTRLAAHGGLLQVLDHHKTAEADLAGLPYCTFNMNKSGAMLAWEHFRPGEPAPFLIEYIQDRDLWRFALPGSREVSAWLRSWPMNFEQWTIFRNQMMSTRGLNVIFAEGGALLRFQAQMVSVMADQAVWQELGGHRVPVVNATVFFSEVGEELCRRHPVAPFAAYYMDRADGRRQWGLRARGDFDCSQVAKQYGGGGHPGASGFTTEAPR
jgi:oligoribonuclease NrnB/cAMP/cGMP phosphodiesterase (DHH superfamily)